MRVADRSGGRTTYGSKKTTLPGSTSTSRDGGYGTQTPEQQDAFIKAITNGGDKAALIQGSPKYNIGLHPGNYPAPVAGQQGKYRPGTISPLQAANSPNFTGTKWCYRFLYNPAELEWSTSLNPDVTPDAMLDKIGLYSGSQAMQFELLINRQMEVAGVPGSAADLANPDWSLLQRLGTLYDIEWIYRVVNGDPTAKGFDIFGYPSADCGFFYTTSLLFNFGRLRWLGYITDVNVKHQMFSRTMVPTLTTVTIGSTRLTNTMLPAAAVTGEQATGGEGDWDLPTPKRDTGPHTPTGDTNILAVGP